MWQGMAMAEMNADTTSRIPVRTAYRTCPLCEATCGLEISVDANDQIVRIRGDKDDVFSKGFICPKGSTLKQLHEDPDRLRRPLVKRDGQHVEVSWDEAWKAVRDGLAQVIDAHGRSSLAVYMGNPGAHNLASMTFNRAVNLALGSFNRFSASTVDQMPKHVAGGFMFGTGITIPVPDIDHTDYLLMLGANPHASNGSLCTAPDFPGRMRAIRERGGKIVVVDPRRTKTAEASDEWLPIIPGTDVVFVAALINELFATGKADVGSHLRSHVNGVDDLRAAVAQFTPEVAASICGIDAATCRRIAAELVAAPTAAVYGRMGVNTVEFGTATAWLVDALNAITGNLDKRGGAMFTLPAAGPVTSHGGKPGGPGFKIGKGHTRVRKYPEVFGEYPVAALGEEILTPGEGQIRALISLAGNPVLSTPNSGQLDTALADLDFMVSVDIYLNETSRHADVILPPPSQLQRDHYDISLLRLAVRNVANYSPAVLPMGEGEWDEWEILAKLAGVLQTLDVSVSASDVDDLAVAEMLGGLVKNSSSNIYGRDIDDILGQLAAEGLRGPTRILDIMLQTGPYGAAYGANPGGVSVRKLLDSPHGIDFGALEPRIPEILRTSSAKVELCPPLFAQNLSKVLPRLRKTTDNEMLLVGRRHLKSNNSWMHNMKVLTKGSLSCTLQVHPEDASRLGLVNGSPAKVTSRVGSLVVPVEVTDAVRTGVVSLPHGWGHNVRGTKLSVAAEKPGVNSNVLTDHERIDELTGNAVLNAIPVSVSAM
jgi:anaerobic selenocysteine-containing dehydrogenase